MANVSEIVFVDPSVDDIETIVCSLRAGVEAIVLDRAIPAARQIVLALRGFHDLEAVHIIAHGAPGQVNFSAGEWSLATLEDDADDLAAVGRALAENSELRLWSCATGEGKAGDQFVDASRALSAPTSPPRRDLSVQRRRVGVGNCRAPRSVRRSRKPA